jgi:hypothetical protein
LAGMVLALMGVVSAVRIARRRAREKGETHAGSGSAAAAR